jgi:dihydroorotate dehydrogenase
MSHLHPLIISAPFGNYVQPKDATPTLGTFTNERRPGRLWRIIRTVRYSPSLGAWVNKIGLRNPGIDWLAAKAKSGKIDVSNKLVSVHGFNDSEWDRLITVTAGLSPLGIELNMSCPNVGHVNWPAWLFERTLERCTAAGSMVVVKIPPVNYQEMVRQALGAGVRVLHCCNTIPVPAGGVSGKPLKPVAIQCIREVRQIAASMGVKEFRIIGGGGITVPSDIDDYAAAGADHFAIGTKCFNPRVLFGDGVLRPLIERANARSIRTPSASSGTSSDHHSNQHRV